METTVNNDWRKLTAVLYRKPQDSKVFGSVEFDVTELEEFISVRRQNGLKLTMTHIFVLAFARGLKEAAPEINCFVRRGKIIQRGSVDVSLSVLVKGGNLSSVKVVGAENFTLEDLCVFLQQSILNVRQGQDDKIKKTVTQLVSIPWPLRQWVADFVKWLSIDWGVPLPFLGVSPDSFGSLVYSNIGTMGLDVGYPALAPFSNVSMVISQGAASSKAVVVNGQIVPRRMITISAALDHRVVDGSQIGNLFYYVRNLIKNPELLEQKVL
ncbi:MAG: 2-oxo acid dehydrogenase subunit E2 [Saprospiraceae bacterium]